MPIYQNSDEMYKVMTVLFSQLLADPAGDKELTKNPLIFRLDISDPTGMITVDSKAKPPTVAYGPNQAKADLVIRTKADVLHRVCMKELRLGEAFFGGKMKVEGSILRAKRLEGLFHVIQGLYPKIVREQKTA
jgi:putative sterol carrier protein